MAIVLWLPPVVEIANGPAWNIVRLVMISTGALVIHALAQASVLEISFRRGLFMSVFQLAFVVTTLVTTWAVLEAYLGP